MAGYYSVTSENSSDSEQEHGYGKMASDGSRERLYNFAEATVRLKRKGCFAAVMTGVFGCLWRDQHYEVKNSKCDYLWLSILVVLSLFATFFLYYWIIAGNSSNEFSWYLFIHAGKWIQVHQIAVIVSAILCGYTVLLFLLSLCHLGCDYRVYLSIFHRVILVLILCVCLATFGYMTHTWTGGWKLVLLSFMVTGIYLHAIFVAVMTGCWWFIMDCNFGRVVSVVRMLVYILALLCLYIAPIFIPKPCVCDAEDLPPKPLLFAHRGAAAIAPENTVLSFENAGAFQETIGFESDVSISYDGVPFLMHDDTLKRTTDVAQKFPGRESDLTTSFNISEIRSLNAGSWFLQFDPFGTVSSLSKEKRNEIQNDLKVPTLDEFLDLAIHYNKSVRFDIKPADKASAISPEHPYFNTYQDVVISTILEHNISQSKVYWLYDGILNSTVENNFTNMYGKKMNHADLLQLSNVNVSVSYEEVSVDDVWSFTNNNVTLDVWVVDSKWLYSLYWCVGVHSVTTNYVHTFSDMKHPVLHLTPRQHLILWIVTCTVSLCLVILMAALHWRKSFHESSDQELLPLGDRDNSDIYDDDTVA